MRNVVRQDRTKLILFFFPVLCVNKLGSGGGKLSQAVGFKDFQPVDFRAALSGTLQLPLLTTECRKSPDCWSPDSHRNGPAHSGGLAAGTKPRSGDP